MNVICGQKQICRRKIEFQLTVKWCDNELYDLKLLASLLQLVGTRNFLDWFNAKAIANRKYLSYHPSMADRVSYSMAMLVR
ncbi:MAG TPA: hypothetical protein V6D28_05910 [Leptolyngbyaceae cyanobacterium]